MKTTTHTASLPLSLVISAALALLAAAACGFLAVSVMSAQSTNVEGAAALADKYGQEQRLSAAAHLSDITKNQRAALAGLVIPLGGNVEFISSIEALARVAKVSASVQSVDAAAPSGTAPGSLSLDVSFGGSYPSVMRFVGLIETMHAALSVSSLSLQYDEATNTWKGTMQLTVLSYDLP